MWKHASVIMQIPKHVNKNIFPNNIMAQIYMIKTKNIYVQKYQK